MDNKSTFYIQGQEKLKTWMERVLKQTGDKTELFEAIGDVLLDGVHDRFKTGHAPDGTPWKKSWRAQVQNGQTLRDTGRLLNSFYVKITNTGAIVSSNVEYAPHLHYGAVITPKKAPYLKFKTPMGGWVSAKRVVLPARPILGVSADDAQGILFEVEEYLQGVLNAK